MSSALFANQRETNLHSTHALIEEVLGELGHNAAESRFPTISQANNPRAAEIGAIHAWRIRRGSAITRVLLVDRAEFTHLRVVAVVMTLDDKVDRNALFAHLLEQNAELCGAAFACQGDQVLMVSERSTLDLDRSEVRELIKRVTTYADDHDDALVAKFGGTLGATT